MTQHPRSARFLALLRGINVGGNNVIAKEDLRACFENLGYTNVHTYIQSGNVLFRSQITRAKELTREITQGLAERFQYDAQAVVIPHRKYRSAVASVPKGWGTDELYRHNALFPLASTTLKKVLAELPPPKDEFESVTVGAGVLFWSISKQYATRTTLMKLPQNPIYQQLTVRNHNTFFKLNELFDQI